MKLYPANIIRKHLTWSQPNFVRICGYLPLESSGEQGRVRMLTERDAIVLVSVDLLQRRGILQSKAVEIGQTLVDYLPKLNGKMWFVIKSTPSSSRHLFHITPDSEEVIAALEAIPGVTVIAVHSLVKEALNLLATIEAEGAE